MKSTVEIKTVVVTTTKEEKSININLSIEEAIVFASIASLATGSSNDSIRGYFSSHKNGEDLMSSLINALAQAYGKTFNEVTEIIWSHYKDYGLTSLSFSETMYESLIKEAIKKLEA